MKRYFDMEDMENLFRQEGLSYTYLTSIKSVSDEEIASTLPGSRLRELYEKKENVFASQNWTKEDIISRFEGNGCENPSEEKIDKVVQEVKGALENCEYGWCMIQAAVEKIMKEDRQ